MNNLEEAMNKVLEYVFDFFDEELSKRSLSMAKIQFKCDYDMK